MLSESNQKSTFYSYTSHLWAFSSKTEINFTFCVNKLQNMFLDLSGVKLQSLQECQNIATF